MKTRIIMACCISAALLLSACGSSGSTSQDTSGQSAVGASQAANVTSADPSSSESGSGAGGSQEADASGYGEASFDIYEDMDGYIFSFDSGSGAWQTLLEVDSDGSFKGTYYDSNAGENSDKYKNGTIYECVFTGALSAAKQVGEYEYTATVEKLEYTKEKDGSDRYEMDNTLYILTDPSGLRQGDEIHIYTAGMPLDQMPESFLSAMEWRFDAGQTELEELCMYDVTSDASFHPDHYAMGDADAGEDGEGWQDFTAVGDYGGKITETYVYTILPASDDTSSDAYAYDEYNKLRVLRWNVTIENAGVKTEISLEADENTRFYPDVSELNVEQDVNFDGRMDVMLCKGSVGSGGDPIYDCYVAMEDGTFKKVEGFDEILRPVFDPQEKIITSNVDESDTSSYLERYRVDGATLEKLESIHYVYDKQKKEWVEAQ